MTSRNNRKKSNSRRREEEKGTRGEGVESKDRKG